MSSPPAPVILFAYKRPEHTKLTVEALQRNPEAADSELWIFADGPRGEADDKDAERTREYLRSISGFRNIILTEREENYGLTRSIVTGVTQVMEKSGRAIIVEDDILTAPSFLNYMNRALDHFENDPDVQSISGHGMPPAGFSVRKTYPYDVYATQRINVWGWGSWLDRWRDVDWQMRGAYQSLTNRAERRALEQISHDSLRFVEQFCAGDITSWDIPWLYDHYKHRRLCIAPVHSYVENIGLDGSGEHCAPSDEYRQELDKAVANPHFMDKAFVDPEIAGCIRRFYKREPVLPREIKRLLKKAGLLKISG